MTSGRLEAFSDAVIAIVMTIMVLELVPPHESTVEALAELWPIFLSYILSFAYLAIYWNNHHHLLQAAKTVSGRVLWANMLLLFWLSLVPFATAWMGENDFASLPVALYGVVLILAAISYYLLVRTLIAAPGQSATIAEVMASDRKGKASPDRGDELMAWVGEVDPGPALGCRNQSPEGIDVARLDQPATGPAADSDRHRRDATRPPCRRGRRPGIMRR